MKLKANFLLLFMAVILAASLAKAQTPAPQDDEDIQSWNDLQLTVPLTKHFEKGRTFLFRVAGELTD